MVLVFYVVGVAMSIFLVVSRYRRVSLFSVLLHLFSMCMLVFVYYACVDVLFLVLVICCLCVIMFDVLIRASVEHSISCVLDVVANVLCCVVPCCLC